jgi:hypothetical protein
MKDDGWRCIEGRDGSATVTEELRLDCCEVWATMLMDVQELR